MAAIFTFFTGTLNRLAWEGILLPCVLAGGVYFTVRTQGVQIFRLGFVLRRVRQRLFSGEKAGQGALTPMQALSTALAATVGTGNIVGTGQAIAMGGCGAVFWLWVAAVLGMVIKYAEVVLAVRFRRRGRSGEWLGGPMYYMTALGRPGRVLGVCFCCFAMLAALGIGNLAQANSVAGSVQVALEAFRPGCTARLPWLNWAVGAALAGLTLLVLLGGVQRIGQVTQRLIPAMSGLYILLTLAVLAVHVRAIPDVLARIFVSAFSPRAVLGAGSGIALGQAVGWGLRRSAFSNEAGLGSAAIAHACAETPGPVEQGFFGIFEVFVDTLVICTLTALAILASGVRIPLGTLPGTELMTAALATVFGARLASLFLSAAMILFAFSTILGWSLYGARCAQWLLGDRAARLYRLLFSAAAAVGAAAPAAQIWAAADTCNALMAIPNFIALFALSGTVTRLTRDYFRRSTVRRPPAEDSFPKSCGTAGHTGP